MQTIQRTEFYTDKGQYAVMTRTTVLDYAKVTRIAGPLRRDGEDLVISVNVPTIGEDSDHD